MTDRYRKAWEKLGAEDPYWAVLTHPGKDSGRWQRADFFATGESEIRHLLGRLEEYGVEVREGTALDFGCGVGRLSRPLARRFESVLAVDVSTSMLKEAQRVEPKLPNINWIHNTSSDLAVVDAESVDFLYSYITLQHMPPSQQLVFIDEFCRVLRSGGVMAFQASTRYKPWFIRGWLYRLLGPSVTAFLRRLRYGRVGKMEVYPLSQSKVLDTLGGWNLDVIAMEANRAAGPKLDSVLYIVRKP